MSTETQAPSGPHHNVYDSPEHKAIVAKGEARARLADVGWAETLSERAEAASVAAEASGTQWDHGQAASAHENAKILHARLGDYAQSRGDEATRTARHARRDHHQGKLLDHSGKAAAIFRGQK